MRDIVERLSGMTKSGWRYNDRREDDGYHCAIVDASAEITTLRSSLKEIREENDRLKGERDEARSVALEEAAKLIEEGYPRPGITNAHGRCPHGLFGWEDCEQCSVAAIRELKDKS